MIKGWTHLTTLLAYKNVEVDVNVASEGLVERILVELGLLLLFVLAPAICPGGLHLLDVVNDVAGAGLAILLHGSLFLSVLEASSSVIVIRLMATYFVRL